MTQDVYATSIYKAVEKAGSVAKLAAAVGVSRQAAYDWLTRGWAPSRRAIQIEELYGIPRAEVMNPTLRATLSSTSNAIARKGQVTYESRKRVTPAVDDLV